jgi:hypothetical protein
MDAKDLVNKATDTAKAATGVVKENFDLTRPVRTRTMNRYKELQEMTRAHHEKVLKGGRIEHITTPPRIHSRNLNVQIVNNEGMITYDVYKSVTEDDVKKDMKSKDGEEINRVVGEKYIDERSEPVIVESVTETVKKHKPIKVDRFKVN